MRKYLFALLVLVAAGTTLLVAAFAVAGGGSTQHQRQGRLDRLPGGRPAVSTTGNGSFEAKINERRPSFDWTLSYAALEGNRHAVAHPLRPARGERRHLDLPLQQPRQRAGWDASLSDRAGDDQRHG